jgi:hypothetical protein
MIRAFLTEIDVSRNLKAGILTNKRKFLTDYDT